MDLFKFFTPHTQHERGICDGLVSIYICVCLCVYDPNKSLNGTLAVDSPFQTLAVDAIDFSLNL